MKVNQPITYNSMDRLTFGKYKGLTTDRVANVDPDYITWMHGAGICDLKTVRRRDRGEFRNDNLPRGYAEVWG